MRSDERKVAVVPASPLVVPNVVVPNVTIRNADEGESETTDVDIDRKIADILMVAAPEPETEPRGGRDDPYEGEESITRRAPSLTDAYRDGDPETIERDKSFVADTSEVEDVTTKGPAHLKNILSAIVVDKAARASSSVQSAVRPPADTIVMKEEVVSAPSVPSLPLSHRSAVSHPASVPSSPHVSLPFAPPVTTSAVIQTTSVSSPPAEEVPRAPRYGLLVAFVAMASISIPIFLFVFLSQSNVEPIHRAFGSSNPRSVASSELTGRTEVVRTKASAQPSASAPASSGTESASPRKGRGPFRR